MRVLVGARHEDGYKRRKGKGRTRVTVIGVSLGRTACDFDVVLIGHLVEGVLAAAELLAGVAMAV